MEKEQVLRLACVCVGGVGLGGRWGSKGKVHTRIGDKTFRGKIKQNRRRKGKWEEGGKAEVKAHTRIWGGGDGRRGK